jgi:hypothetical protein
MYIRVIRVTSLLAYRVSLLYVTPPELYGKIFTESDSLLTSTSLIFSTFKHIREILENSLTRISLSFGKL